jgi:endoglucanase
VRDGAAAGLRGRFPKGLPTGGAVSAGFLGRWSGSNPDPAVFTLNGFWTSVANTFKNDTSVVFDLFNEPYPDRAASASASASDQAWTCWRDGGTCPGIGYDVAGMQDMLDAVRGTGARTW